MKQGASRHALVDRANDFYETPREATLALLRNEPFSGVIWEPCAGRGAISRELEAAGHTVVKQDLVSWPEADNEIKTPIDFLMEQVAPSGCSCIVTNPPYKLSDEFIRHGLSLVGKVVVLLRLMALEGAKRSDLIDSHLVRVWAGIERLPMMHRYGWEGRKNGNSGAPFAWFVFEAAPRGVRPIELRRISWRNGA
ncbi:class I SAM-dependent methyltransferase [Pseudochelatococcus sp. G4_1912]|uniref:class I SAM-dependent methyltransferase n=1 Tax=Pseudochelatococcus sp. G4_1912 TaxID=3114288 RepID=UPI0039C73EEF